MIHKTGCNITWHNRSNTAAIGVIFYPQYRTIDDCLNSCAFLLPDCVAAQVRNATNQIQCFLVTNKNNLLSARSSKDINLYSVIKQCAQVTISKCAFNVNNKNYPMA